MSISPHYIIKRREHVDDPNIDSKADFETVNLTIINSNINDSAYYLCIVANSPKSFRLTYSYLNVLPAVDMNTNTFINTTSTDLTIQAIENVGFNKYLVIISSTLIAIFLLFVALLVLYCYSTKLIKRKLIKLNKMNDNDKGSDYEKKLLNGLNSNENIQVNSMIEKTLSNMKKVKLKIRKCLIAVFFFNDEFIVNLRTSYM